METKKMNKLTMTTEGDTHIVVIRHFNAPPEFVYRAHTEPEIVQKWLLGPDGWTMPGCVCEAVPGGKIRYEWANESKGESFFLTGEFVDLTPYSRLEQIERMHLPGPDNQLMVTPDNHVVTTFEADGSGTLMTMRMTLPDEATRSMMLSSGMESGMEDSYVRLDEMSA